MFPKATNIATPAPKTLLASVSTLLVLADSCRICFLLFWASLVFSKPVVTLRSCWFDCFNSSLIHLRIDFFLFVLSFLLVGQTSWIDLFFFLFFSLVFCQMLFYLLLCLSSYSPHEPIDKWSINMSLFPLQLESERLSEDCWKIPTSKVKEKNFCYPDILALTVYSSVYSFSCSRNWWHSAFYCIFSSAICSMNDGFSI